MKHEKSSVITAFMAAALLVSCGHPDATETTSLQQTAILGATEPSNPQGFKWGVRRDVDSILVFGNFSAELRDSCRRKNGGNACNNNDWAAGPYLNQFRRDCVARLGNVSACGPGTHLLPAQDQSKRLKLVSYNGNFNSIAQRMHVSLQDGITSAHQNLSHLRNVGRAFPMTLAEGRRFYFEGLVPRVASNGAFFESTRTGQEFSLTQSAQDAGVPNAPCAVSVSSLLQHAGWQLHDKTASVFSNLGSPHWRTEGVEADLVRLGWNYFPMQSYVAPRGAVGLATGRSGGNGPSGHIYFIVEDTGTTSMDLVADNLFYFAHRYGTASTRTDGFWLPPGVAPQRR